MRRDTKVRALLGVGGALLCGLGVHFLVRHPSLGGEADYTRPGLALAGAILFLLLGAQYLLKATGGWINRSLLHHDLLHRLAGSPSVTNRPDSPAPGEAQRS